MRSLPRNPDLAIVQAGLERGFGGLRLTPRQPERGRFLGSRRGGGGGAGSPKSRVAEIGRQTGASGWRSRRRSLGWPSPALGLRPGLFRCQPVEHAQQHVGKAESGGGADDADPGARLEAERRLGGGEQMRQAGGADQPAEQIGGHGEGDHGHGKAGKRGDRQIERIAPEPAGHILMGLAAIM